VLIALLLLLAGVARAAPGFFVDDDGRLIAARSDPADFLVRATPV
jgi:hypothetical protein